MKLRALRSFTVLFIATASLAAAGAKAALFQNGSFESFIGPDGYFLSAVTVPGWTYSGGDYSAVFTYSNQYGIAAQDGGHYISFGHLGNSGEKISQIFDTTPGAPILVSFWLARQQWTIGDGNASEKVTVRLSDGVRSYEQTYVPNVEAWTRIELPAFTPANVSTVLSFTNTSSGSSTNWGVDNVSVTPATCSEDLNNDGTINLTDLATLLSNFGLDGATRAQGDINGDGSVNLTDLAMLLAVFGSNC